MERLLAGAADFRAPIDIFFERDDGYQYLGEATLAVFGTHAGAPAHASLHLRAELSREHWLELQDPVPPHGAPYPESGIAALTSTSSTADRIEALRLFVERWFGTGPDASPLPQMPTPLAALHRLTRANPKMIGHNALVPPHELERRDGRTVFYVENQHVCEWAFDDEGEDPAVWYRENDHRARWEREPEPLSAFVIQLVLLEASLGGRAFGGAAGCLDLPASDRLRNRFRPLPFGLWCWGPTSFHARDGALLVMMENGDHASTAMVAAQHPEALSCIADLVDDQWETVAF